MSKDYDTEDAQAETYRDEAFDRTIDDIICSDDFAKCPWKSHESNCEHPEEVKRSLEMNMYLNRCWYVRSCPAGFGRI